MPKSSRENRQWVIAYAWLVSSRRWLLPSPFHLVRVNERNITYNHRDILKHFIDRQHLIGRADIFNFLWISNWWTIFLRAPPFRLTIVGASKSRFFPEIAWKIWIGNFNSFYELIWINQKIISGVRFLRQLSSTCHAARASANSDIRWQAWWMIPLVDYYLLFLNDTDRPFQRSTGAFDHQLFALIQR